MIDDVLLIKEWTDGLVRMQDVALGAAIEGSFIGKFMVDANQRRVFMDFSWRGVGELVGVPIRLQCECGVRKAGSSAIGRFSSEEETSV